MGLRSEAKFDFMSSAISVTQCRIWIYSCYSFGLLHWFKFGLPVVSSPPSFDVSTEVSMVEGMLMLLITLLSSRLHLGLSEQEILRQEMVAQLCMGDKTHNKPGQSHNSQEFEGTLSELADYRGPSFESGSMQQGIYVPKDFVWKNEFDFVHVLLRAVHRQDAVEDINSLADVVHLVLYLTKLAVMADPKTPHLHSTPHATGDESRDIGCIIVDRCIDFLDTYENQSSTQEKIAPATAHPVSDRTTANSQTRTHYKNSPGILSGLSEQEILRQEMVAQLCMETRLTVNHACTSFCSMDPSGLITCSCLNIAHIPDKPGQSHNSQEFEGTLSELADYRGPSFESGSMQQGIYVPKDFVWKNEFDFVHVLLRAVHRQDVQSAMQRYQAYASKNGQPQKGQLWPPFLSLKPITKKFCGLTKILHSKILHGVFFFIFHKAVEDINSLADVVHLVLYLTKLAVMADPKTPHLFHNYTTTHANMSIRELFIWKEDHEKMLLREVITTSHTSLNLERRKEDQPGPK
ncbi:E3 ubiquitin-protein ligase ubr3 [Desmophyllum pertusum]|uniref:E3 ubiquitin-protein ligase n=1 Tax=Desmophyllum pertusum TaxID=174260 RepID=A0A9W9Z501_9CNID|nr:E3 ubiquitin-protein ligase ubr3 [Desmophyllum pertusum]